MYNLTVEKIFIEQSPNPDVLLFKPFGFSVEIDFVLSIPFDGIESDFFSHLKDKFSFVKGIYIHQNAIGILKNSNTEWSDDIKKSLTNEICVLLNTGTSLFSDNSNIKKEWQEGTVEYKISTILEERVRPAVAADGGDVELYAFKDGIAYIDLRGACVGCPSSTATLRVAIKRILSHFVDEVEDVDTPDNMIN